MADQPAPRIVAEEDVQRLLSLNGSTVLSIYHPTERAVVQPEENSLHLKNLLSEAGDTLSARGLKGKELNGFLSPLEDMLGDRSLWMNQLSGLALFRTMDSLEVFRLPYPPPEVAHLGDAPYVLPLLPSFWPDQRFYILALSQKSVRLVHCTRYAHAEIDLSDLDMPQALAEELEYDDLQKPELQHHPTTGPGRSAEGQAGQTGRQQSGRRHDFHGHGEDGDDQKVQIARFFNSVDKGLHAILKNERVPVVLAGVDYLHAIYKENADYQNIAETGIEGNVDRLSTAELHEKAVPLIDERRASELEELRERYGTAGAHGLASSELEEILAAAHEGRIEVLFVEANSWIAGSYDPTGRRTTYGEETGEGEPIDLLDLGARTVINASGRVYVIDAEEMPVESKIAALYRYNPAT